MKFFITSVFIPDDFGVEKNTIGVYANMTSTAARTSSENVTSRFCINF